MRPRYKQIGFLLFTLLLPLGSLLVLEGLLRLAGYGQDFDLFHDQAGQLVTNSGFPAKYFNQQGIAVPQVIEQHIPKRRSGDLKRIVCLGGSTTAGFPYEVNINFPYFLEKLLEKNQAGIDFELINLGISAVNSHTVRDMLPQVEEIKPDAVCIYMGHNEFYGAYGIISNPFLARHPFLLRLSLRLKEFRTSQLIQNLITRLSDLMASDKTARGQTLMQAMLGNAVVDPGSEQSAVTRQNFADNLSAIIDYWQEKSVPVFLSTLVSNLRDQFPLDRYVDTTRSAALDAFMEREALKTTADSVQALTALLQKHQDFASAHYLLAGIYYKKGNIIRARRHFSLARDYDRIPFRAPQEMNHIILQVARAKGVPVVRTDSLFAAHAPAGIPGNELFLEHLHPNASGYALLAQSFFAKLKRYFIFRQPAPADNRPGFHYTSLDLAIGDLKTEQLIQGPPFNGRIAFSRHAVELPQVWSLAEEHLKRGLFWDGAHLKLAGIFQDSAMFARARDEYLAILEYDSTHKSALDRLGNLYFRQKRYDEALAVWQRLADFHPASLNVLAKMGKVFVLQGKNPQAISVLQRLITNAQATSRLKPAALTEVRYLLALALARTGRLESANEQLNRALEADAGYGPALKLRAKIKKSKHSN